MRRICKAEDEFYCQGKVQVQGTGVGGLKIQMWEGVTNVGGVAGAQVQSGESLKTFLGPPRHRGGRAPCWQWHEAISPPHESDHGHKIWNDTRFGH